MQTLQYVRDREGDVQRAILDVRGRGSEAIRKGIEECLTVKWSEKIPAMLTVIYSGKELNTERAKTHARLKKRWPDMSPYRPLRWDMAIRGMAWIRFEPPSDGPSRVPSGFTVETIDTDGLPEAERLN
jgi:hypothetical protein